MFRHIGKHRDPWTQEILTGDEKIAMTLEGVTDLLTLGTNLGAAAINQGFNFIIQGIENKNWSTFELGIIREVYEMYENLTDKGLDKNGKVMSGAKKYAKVELLANLIQLGLIVYKNDKFQVVSEESGGEKVSEELVEKYTITYEE